MFEFLRVSDEYILEDVNISTGFTISLGKNELWTILDQHIKRR